MKKLLFVSLLITTLSAFSQTEEPTINLPALRTIPKKEEKTQPSRSAIKTFNDKLELAALMRATEWSLYFQYRNQDQKPKTNTEVVQYLKDSALKLTNKAQINSAIKLFSSLPLFGDELAQYLPGEDYYSVLKFELDGGSVMLIDGASSSNIYNTLRSTAKQRAAMVLSKNILPALKLLRNGSDLPQTKYLALSFTYSSKDFSDESEVLNLKPEYLCAVFPIDNIKKFNNNLITQEDLLNSSHFYLRDRDNLSTVKIKLEIQ